MCPKRDTLRIFSRYTAGQTDESTSARSLTDLLRDRHGVCLYTLYQSKFPDEGNIMTTTTAQTAVLTKPVNTAFVNKSFVIHFDRQLGSITVDRSSFDRLSESLAADLERLEQAA